MNHRKRNINIGGGTYVEGDVNTGGGDFVGRDKIVHNNGMNSDDAARLFATLYATIDRHPRLDSTRKEDLKAEIQELRGELAHGAHADEGFLLRRFRNIARIAPDILELTLATMINPALGLGVFAKKLADKARAEN